jgi:hypothetical protein
MIRVNYEVRWLGLFVTLALAQAAGAGKPDFTGTWANGGTAKGSSTLMRVEYRDPALEVSILKETVATEVSLGAGLRSHGTYTTDGTETVAKDHGSGEVRSWKSVYWSGDSLVFQTLAKRGYRVTVTRETWTLSNQGHTLTVATRTVDMDGVTENALVFDKQ